MVVADLWGLGAREKDKRYGDVAAGEVAKKLKKGRRS